MTNSADSAARAIRAAINDAPMRRFQILLVVTILVVLIIDGVDLQLLSLVAPLILEEWNLERSDFGLALSAALVGMSLGALIGGYLGDKVGRRLILLGSTLLFGVATIAAGMSDSVMIMTGFRLVSGLGFGAAAPNGIALASDWLPDRMRPQITSLLSIGTPAGGMVGAALVLGILPMAGWRAAFYACGALTLLFAVGVLFLTRESPFYHLARGNSAGARSALGRYLGLEVGASGPPPGASEAGGDPPDRQSFMAQALFRLTAGSAVGFFALTFVSLAFIAWTPIMLTSVGFDVDQSITATLFFNLSAVVAALIGGFLIARLGSRAVLAGTTTVLVIVLLALGVSLGSMEAAPGPGEVRMTYVLVGASGGFAGMGMASIYTIMATGYPPACRAGGIGFGLMMGRIGGILASYSGGYLLEAGDSGLWSFILVLSAFTLVAWIMTFVVDRHVTAGGTVKADAPALSG